MLLIARLASLELRMHRICGKADTVHSLQGVTIGDDNKRVVLTWDQNAESKWAGIHY